MNIKTENELKMCGSNQEKSMYRKSWKYIGFILQRQWAICLILVLSLSILLQENYGQSTVGLTQSYGNTITLEEFSPASWNVGRFIESLQNNSRFAWDASVRSTQDINSKHSNQAYFIGMDYLKTFSSNDGDWGTLSLQFYLTKLNNLSRHPPFFEGEDDLELVHRFSYFNYTGLARGKLNLKIGHFGIPYGLAVPVNTNGTIRQVLTGADLGIKGDWGVSINGVLPKAQYEFSLTRGTRNEWNSNGDPFVFAGRIGTTNDQEIYTGSPGLGVSVFYGDVSGRIGTTNRFRLGVDGTMYFGPFTLLGEISAGRDEQMDIANGLIEVNWIDVNENLNLYAQLRSLNREISGYWKHGVSSALGFRYSSINSWVLSAQYAQDLRVMGSNQKEGYLSAQMRYRF